MTTLPPTEAGFTPEDFSKQWFEIHSLSDRCVVCSVGARNRIFFPKVSTNPGCNCLVTVREVEFAMDLAIGPEIRNRGFELPDPAHHLIQVDILLIIHCHMVCVTIYHYILANS